MSPRNVSITQPKHVLLQTVIKIGHENIGLISESSVSHVYFHLAST